jgi:haloalkane dehalogenase
MSLISKHSNWGSAHMTDFMRTPDDNFANLADFPFEANYHQWQDSRMHYVDVGPKDAPVMLLLHGMPSWSYLYRDMIPPCWTRATGV